MLKIIRILKKLPIDFNQYEMREKTKGKLIALDLIENGRNKKALDLGCRDGYWSRRLENDGYEVVAADIEPCYEKAIVVDANQRLPFSDAEFDLVWSSEVIEHLDNPVFSTEEMLRILKPNGKLVLTTPNSNFWFFRLLKIFAPIEKLQTEHHKQFFSISNIKMLLPEAKIFRFFPYFILKFKISNLKLVDWLSPVFVIYQEKK
jgi:SAM-dependent methyltransferase